MKAVLISIQPKWCKKIADGEKTIEVRKTKPNLQTPFKCYIYMTKAKPYWLEFVGGGKMQARNGMVIGEFVCDSFYGITNFLPYDGEDCHHSVTKGVLEQTCLEDYEIDEYLGKKDGYGWHITDLKIYDKPKELGNFAKAYPIKCGKGYESIDCSGCGSEFTCNKRFITRPPQSWCYVEELQNG